MGETILGHANPIALLLFFVFVLTTLPLPRFSTAPYVKSSQNSATCTTIRTGDFYILPSELLNSLILLGFIYPAVSMLIGLIAAVGFTTFSPIAWAHIFENANPTVLLSNLALIFISISFLAGMAGSLMRLEEKAEERFKETRLKSYTGVSAGL